MPGVGAWNSDRWPVPRKWHLRWALGLSVSLGLACRGAGRTRLRGAGLGWRVQECAALAVSEYGTLGATESKNPGNEGGWPAGQMVEPPLRAF